MSDGIIYGIDIDRKDCDTAGISVAFIARLPHWAVISIEDEITLRHALHVTMGEALGRITGSQASQDNRRRLMELAGRANI